MAQWIKHLPCKREDLSLVTRTHIKMSGLVMHLLILELRGGRRQRIPTGLGSLVIPRLMRDLVS